METMHDILQLIPQDRVGVLYFKERFKFNNIAIALLTKLVNQIVESIMDRKSIHYLDIESLESAHTIMKLIGDELDIISKMLLDISEKYRFMGPQEQDEYDATTKAQQKNKVAAAANMKSLKELKEVVDHFLSLRKKQEDHE